MVAMNYYAASASAVPAAWPLQSPHHRLAITVRDAELSNALRTALVLRPEFIAANDNDADIVITDMLLDAEHRAPVLVVGSDAKGRYGETVIPSLDPAFILSAAAVLASGYRIAEDRKSDHIHLSAREREVAGLLVEGASNKLIARELEISVHTAKFHVTAVLDKLGARNRSDAVAIALREGLVTL